MPWLGAVALAIVMLPAAATAGALATGTCQTLDATITGTSGDDAIRGTARDDVIDGGAGNDRIDGLGGDDVDLRRRRK